VPDQRAGQVGWRAPGRVNLIGEHTDYNGGLALPFAIEQTCLAEVTLTDHGYRATSEGAGSVTLTSLEEVATTDTWVRYVLGTVVVLDGRGVEVPPLRVRVDSEVPSGAGLSSSAALICSVVAAVDDLLGLGLGRDEQVRLAVAVENEVVGAPTGGLDQLVSVHAQAGHALLCDFADPRSPVVEQVPLHVAGHGLSVLVVDTGVRHSHADGEYAARRSACEDAAVSLGVGHLGELGPAGLEQAARGLGEEQQRYVRHVVTEDQRVREVVALLRDDRVAQIGPLLSASHRSLRDDYEVSCLELDLAVTAMVSGGALGARMTGGGFGGCAIGLVPADQVDEVAGAVQEAYAGAGLAAPRWFSARPSAGTRPARDPGRRPAPPTG
jgi:galactokinase